MNQNATLQEILGAAREHFLDTGQCDFTISVTRQAFLAVITELEAARRLFYRTKRSDPREEGPAYGEVSFDYGCGSVTVDSKGGWSTPAGTTM